jgi:hypothetical protein
VSRRLRFIPEERTLVEVTTRTVHGRYLLRPSPRLDAIIIGALARLVKRYGVRCIGFAFVSSHFPAKWLALSRGLTTFPGRGG